MANTYYYSIISITWQKLWKKETRNPFYFREAKKFANQSQCYNFNTQMISLKKHMPMEITNTANHSEYKLNKYSDLP